jgi:preprotein translocase subunit SecB
MKQSVITLRDLTFLAIKCEIDPDYKGPASEFDFQGAFLHWGLRHGKSGDDGRTWWVGLDFATRQEGDKRCPYALDIKAVGMFSVNESVPEERREELAFENGAALVYGAIREMVSTITARSAFGTLLLPTASFVGEFQKHQEKLAQQAAQKAAAEGNGPSRVQ